MKKIGALLSIVVIGLMLAIYVNNNNVKNDSYIYKITDINGNEIQGEAITKKSDDNVGLFLYRNEDNLKVGDKVSVVWGKNNEIKKIKNVE